MVIFHSYVSLPEGKAMKNLLGFKGNLGFFCIKDVRSRWWNQQVIGILAMKPGDFIHMVRQVVDTPWMSCWHFSWWDSSRWLELWQFLRLNAAVWTGWILFDGPDFWVSIDRNGHRKSQCGTPQFSLSTPTWLNMCNFGKRWDALSVTAESWGRESSGSDCYPRRGGRGPGPGIHGTCPKSPFYGWYGYHSQSWGVYGIGSATF